MVLKNQDFCRESAKKIQRIEFRGYRMWLISQWACKTMPALKVITVVLPSYEIATDFVYSSDVDGEEIKEGRRTIILSMWGKVSAYAWR